MLIFSAKSEQLLPLGIKGSTDKLYKVLNRLHQNERLCKHVIKYLRPLYIKCRRVWSSTSGPTIPTPPHLWNMSCECDIGG
jgi:hypothetical protein